MLSVHSPSRQLKGGREAPQLVAVFPMIRLVTFPAVPDRFTSGASHLRLFHAIFVSTEQQLVFQMLVCRFKIGITRHGLDTAQDPIQPFYINALTLVEPVKPISFQ
jgi:hypothetical protein